MLPQARNVLAGVWTGLGGDPAALERITITGPTHVLPSVFPVTAAATAAVGAATLAAAELWRVRSGDTHATAVDARHAALAFRSERLTEVVGKDQADVWGAVSGDYATRDGWIRIHANFRRHREAALRALSLPTGAGEVPTKDTVRTAVARWEAVALEDTIYREGGCAGALRSVDGWQAAPQSVVVRAQPLVALTPLGGSDGTHATPDDLDRPLRGMRVLDLTRVIAGPVAARFLAAYGAEVLRVDAPDSDDGEQVVIDTTVGKRSAYLDLHDDAGRSRLAALVRKADVVLCAYRPGALEDLGFDPPALAKLRPGVVVGTLSAYGGVGPWGQRRGFDSLVQMTTGLADAGRRAADAEVPVSLPCQALDHASGYLLAAGVLSALARRTAASRGGGWQVQVSLARTSTWLEGLGHSGALDIADPGWELPEDLTVDLHGPLGHSRHIACPGVIVGAAPHWECGPVPLGHDQPTWG